MASPGGNVCFLPCTPQSSNRVYDEHQGLIQDALSRNASSDHAALTRLDLILLVTGLTKRARSSLFQYFQKLIADTYTLVCLTAAERKIDLDFPGGLDVRLYAVDAGAVHDLSTALASISGPITTLTAFQGSAAGQHAKPELAKILNEAKLEDVPGDHTTNAKTHLKVAVGGTFDHLHIGHKLLLTMIVFIAQPASKDREFTIGITGDELLVKKKHASVLESWDVRQQRSADFVESILIFHPDPTSIRTTKYLDQPGPNGKVVKVIYDTGDAGKVTVNYVRLSDPFGPTITDESITAIVISAETRAGAKAVNDKRNEQGWASLEVFEVDVLDPASINQGGQATSTQSADNFATKISSTEIRRRLETGASK